MMNEEFISNWEVHLTRTAQQLPYPPTPDIASCFRAKKETKRITPLTRFVSKWQVGWGALIICIILSGILALPSVQAAVQNILRLGGVHIFLDEPTLEPVSTAISVTPLPEKLTTATRYPTPTRYLTPTPLLTWLDLAGATTLSEAQDIVDFPLKLPNYPPTLGKPDHVFVQTTDGPIVIFIWLQSEQSQKVALVLFQLGTGAFVSKGAPETIEKTTVNGESALWLKGPHLVQLNTGQVNIRQFIDGHVLVWMEGDITYRLETARSLSEARQIAESLIILK